MKTVDVGAVLDEGRWTGYQKLLIFGTALTIILDGVDNQLLPNAIPSLMKEWGRHAARVQRRAGPGPVRHDDRRRARRHARRPLRPPHGAARQRRHLCGPDPRHRLGEQHLHARRCCGFIAGIGLGGAMPNAASLASEYVPRRQRPFAVTLTIVCIPLGGMLAAELAARFIPAYGWRALFIAGGLVPVVLAVVLWKVLPESPRFLARHRERWPELTRTMRRMGHDVPDDVAYIGERAAATHTVQEPGLASLFTPDYRRDTLALFGSFFFCLMVNYVLIQLVRADADRRRLHAAGGQPRAAVVESRRRRRRHPRRADHSAPRIAGDDARHVGWRNRLFADHGRASARPERHASR